MNVSPKIGLVISLKPELYPALCTVLGTEDLEDILEVITIDGRNALTLAKQREHDAHRY